MKITIIQHVAFEVPGLIDEWIATNHHQRQLVKLFETDYQLPEPNTIDFLIVLGGPMSANDDLNWIRAERQLIKQVVQAGKPMLGVCLGAQQLAKAFGSQIIPTAKEVGLGAVESTNIAQRILGAKTSYQVLHWHGEGFELPAGAQQLFTSRYWQNQGFELGSAIGLQFHLESTPQTLAGLIAADQPFLIGSVLGESADQLRQLPFDLNCRTLLFTILNHLACRQ
ncbi:GMP synthase [Lentilactobacillus fungorum]|uniref:GMP synthase n=1 Tax=Lentilactobacillus fungorum TaxID=2201250 RepID=A0ABQ3W073_9LACO|nr:type 1 glutamine amidotransferase [Lentilactobacillus fungorum]GHP13074.1 GMP synthase [Lentilactobacillus fungorum]